MFSFFYHHLHIRLFQHVPFRPQALQLLSSIIIHNTSDAMMTAAYTQPHCVFARTVFGQETYPVHTRQSRKAAPALPSIREESGDQSAASYAHLFFLSLGCTCCPLNMFACPQNSDPERQRLPSLSWYPQKVGPYHCVSWNSTLALDPGRSADIRPCKQIVSPTSQRSYFREWHSIHCPSQLGLYFCAMLR